MIFKNLYLKIYRPKTTQVYCLNSRTLIVLMIVQVFGSISSNTLFSFGLDRVVINMVNRSLKISEAMPNFIYKEMGG